jgi:hypothetical protein
MCEPQRLTTLWASTACYRVSFTLCYYYYYLLLYIFAKRNVLSFVCIRCIVLLHITGYYNNRAQANVICVLAWTAVTPDIIQPFQWIFFAVLCGDGDTFDHALRGNYRLHSSRRTKTVDQGRDLPLTALCRKKAICDSLSERNATWHCPGRFHVAGN